jgi:hypothetical protein
VVSVARVRGPRSRRGAAPRIEHIGDSRGNSWYTKIWAWPNGAAATAGTDIFIQYDLGPTSGQTTIAAAPPNSPENAGLPFITGIGA